MNLNYNQISDYCLVIVESISLSLFLSVSSLENVYSLRLFSYVFLLKIVLSSKHDLTNLPQDGKAQ